MNIPTWVWIITMVGLSALLLFDLAIVGRRPHEPSMRESSIWVAFYVGLAGLFGLGILATSGPKYAGEFFAGWVTEYSLSVDNLFIFVLIMTNFAVPRIYQQKVLLIGIVIALIMRGAFIAAGAALISKFTWVFYIFGVFLVYTAYKLARGGEVGDDEYHENVAIRWARKVLPVTDRYNRAKLTRRVNGKLFFTPMLVVMIAIGTTDLIFALDSIPAIFGLTKEPYLVFTANVFALMGLRQLFFLLGGLLNRLVYLSIGLAVVLGFIGVKLVMEAVRDNNLPFINGGEPVHAVPHIPIWLSLAVILGTLIVTTVLSIMKSSREARRGAIPPLPKVAPAGPGVVDTDAPTEVAPPIPHTTRNPGE